MTKKGATLTSPQLDIPARGVHHSYLDDVMPEVNQFLAKTNGMGSLLIDRHGLARIFHVQKQDCRHNNFY